MRALCGQVNPSGKLAETYPLSERDVACAEIYSKSPLSSDYAEGIYVGYKYYSSFNKRVKYPFGYGLSYTRFEYSGFFADESGAEVTVKNAGSVAGAEVVQIYIRAPRADVEVSPRELKAFCKVFLAAGESRRVRLPFDGYAFRIWNMQPCRFGAAFMKSL